MTQPDSSGEPAEGPDASSELVHRIRDGQVAAEAELVERYSRGVLYLLRRMTGDSDLANDLHQDTFRVVLEGLRAGRLENPQRLAAFVRATARNLFIGDYRKKARRDTHSDSDLVEKSADSNGSQRDQREQLLQRERANAVRHSLSELKTQRDREILYRFYIAEEDKEDICSQLGLSDLHFNRVLFRARQRFKKVLERSGERRPETGEASVEVVGS